MVNTYAEISFILSLISAGHVLVLFIKWIRNYSREKRRKEIEAIVWQCLDHKKKDGE